MWTHTGKLWVVPKDNKYGIMISNFQYQEFGFWYQLTVPYFKSINKYHAFRPKVLIQVQKLPSRDILVRNPSPREKYFFQWF